MKILIITKKFPYPFIDGETIAINSLTRGLSAIGVEMDLLALNTTKHYYDFNPDIRPHELNAYSDIYTIRIDNRIKIYTAFKNLFSRLPYQVSRYYSGHSADLLSNILKRKIYDIIQLEGLQLMVYYDEIRSLTKSPIILRAHNQEHYIWDRLLKQHNIGLRKHYLKLQQNRLKLFEMNAAQKVDAIFPITEVDSVWFKKYNDHVLTVPMGMSVSTNDSNKISRINPDLLHIGFIGSLDWLPNLEGLRLFLDKVYQKNDLRNKPYKLIIAGRNSSAFKLDLKQMDDIEYLGEIEDAEIFWNQIDVLIVPLMSGSGVRIKILEAMSRKKIVLSTSVGIEGIPVLNGQEAIIEDRLEKWASILTKINEHHDKYDDMRHKASLLIEKNYSPKIISTRVTEYYERLIKEYA